MMNSLSTVHNRLLHTGATLLGGLLLALGVNLLTTEQASAQAAYGSYVGIGGAFGLSSGDDAAGEDSSSGVVLAFRYRILEAPISLRAQALIGNGVALVPTVSYDIPLNWQTDLYVGAGISLPLGSDTDRPTPVGNQTAFVLQPGVDYSFPFSDLVLFGNAIIAFDAYEVGGDTAFSLQGGLGLRF